MIADHFDAPSDDPAAFDALADLFLGSNGSVAAHDAAMGVAPRGMRGSAGGGSSVGAGVTSADAAASVNVNGAFVPAGPVTPAATGAPLPTRVREGPRLVLVNDLNPARESGAEPPGVVAAPPGRARRGRPGRGDAGEDERGSGGMTRGVEVVILGHLPVMASAWASQYARHAADRVQGPVAVARVSGGRVRIEMVPPAGGVVGGLVEARGLEPGAPRDLDAALSIVRASARRVIVFGEGVLEERAARARGVSRVTLLSSGDEAGVVAAYGIVKRLAGAIGDRAEDEGPVLHVAVMGAPPARAEYVLDRLERACRTFLRLPLRRDTCIARIGGGPVGVEVYDGPLDAPVEDLVAMLAVGEVGEAGPPAFEPVNPEVHPGSATAAAQYAAPSATSPCPLSEVASNDAADPSAEDAPDGLLSDLVCAGLETLEARCPGAPEVEIALDESGVLHVLARAEAYAEPGRALVRLATAAGWAWTNRRVLGLTRARGGPMIDESAAVVSHLFTDQPARWRGLLDAPIRMHVMLPARPTAGAWACADLN
ncbi:MAG: hypothetical protein JNK35_07825 [Phycisphaerae bacterium]|nr:hypothetical protein [Phycisphaerae bacterium]